ncbi:MULTISPECIES: hypothetical protein [unclassified Arcicella]|uniref:hypothetical protein n=1 Tax=unclassified Arcicella TaxID=2644986 RepID=UPI00285EDF94|nr:MULTISPECIES: hypothetical protein [unclassified Arcicella]MDR6563804.1 hypothetical protein [Arcicella sp. BE51]MDR6813512.1 hypothetical protein [Arcicella sp. BE140]MDR6824825.1 hypothetical protein [Arcicella sp. BE139]
MIGIKKEMFHNSHLFYESLAEGFEKQCSTGSYLPTAQHASDGDKDGKTVEPVCYTAKITQK